MQSPVLERCVLTVAGSDSCGGAGIQADLNTFAAFGVYGASVLTAITARNTLGVQALEAVSDHIVVAQMESVLQDLPVRAVKTGLLPSVAGIAVLGAMLAEHSPQLPLVVDPVVIGRKLTGDTALEAVQNHLFPLATVITPNLEEASELTGRQINNMGDMESVARELLQRGPQAVLLKGGRFGGDTVNDILVTATGTEPFGHQAFAGRFHGTGCTLSAAITAGLAADKTLHEAVQDAIEYVQTCLQNSLAPLKGRMALLGHPSR